MVTIALIVVNAAVWAYELSLPEPFLQQLFFQAGAVPIRFTGQPYETALDLPPAPLTALTCMFVHGGWWHVIGNMWFLWVFGDNVEDAFGKVLFPVFYLLTGLAATAVHVLADPTSVQPVVGASGAISGVLGAYAVLYPRARVHTLLVLFIFIRTVYLPAILFLGIWFAFQFLSLGEGGVAWWAHIGGFAAGALIALALRAGRSRRRA